jgi:hypothetical protein
VDKKGVAVALAFLLALGALAGGRGEHPNSVEDLIQRTNVVSRDTSSPGPLEDERAVMDRHLTIMRHRVANPGPVLRSVPWLSMPYLSGPFKVATFFVESPAAAQTDCSTGRPDLMEALQRDSDQILRSPNSHWPSFLFQDVREESGTPCQSPAHPSTLLLLTDNRLSVSGE